MTPASAPTSGAVRLLRAAVLGAVALGLAVVAHVVAGGAAPGIGSLLVLGVLTGTAVLVLTTVRLRATGLLAALGGLELFLHAGLTLLTASGTAEVVAGGHHHTHLVVTQAHAHSAHGLWMTLAHALATALTAVVLARGEELLWLAAGITAPLLVVVAARAAAALRALAPLPALPPAVLPQLRRLHWALAAPHRGPPVLV